MKKYYLHLCLFLVIFLGGCVAVQPFPHAVRAGDTITLAIGSLDNVMRENISITYYPDPGSLPSDTPVDVTAGIRSVFNIYPDKKSKVFMDTTSGGGFETMSYLEQISGHSAWQTVIAVDLPPTLPTGTGYFTVTLGAGVIYPPFSTDVGNVNVQAQILDAGGDAHSFEYRTFGYNSETSTGILSSLEQLRQVVVKNTISGSTSRVPIAAAEYNLVVPVIDEFSSDVSNQVPNGLFLILLDEQVNYDRNQTVLNWSRVDSTIKVVITSLSGDQDANLIRFSVLMGNYASAEANSWSLADSPSLASVKYFDLNGDEVFGPLPVVVVQ